MEPVFPEVGTCSCLTDVNGPSGSIGVGCADWNRDDKIWCFVSEDCNLEKELDNYYGQYVSYDMCKAVPDVTLPP